ncbi:MAG TPA: ring-opening amidohydrolase, partial [Acidimicrobiales bacterium]|nr:ring-opening amidohydrolase [Acidimicrobiales bacterium]
MPYVVHKVVLENVSDASGLAGLIESGGFTADDVVAVIGKTEGNGGVNDFTRILADQAFRGVLLEQGTRSRTEVEQIPMVWSGGTDGVLTPHATVFARVPGVSGEGSGSARLSVGVAMSDVILPEHIGRPEMVATVAEGVRRAMADAGIDDATEVHYVQTKTPLLTMATIEEARGRGEDTVTDEPLESMNLSNGTTALGIAVALGEIETPAAEAIGRDLALFSSVASCS